MMRLGFLRRPDDSIFLISAAGDINSRYIHLCVQQYLLTSWFLTLFALARDI